MPDKKEVLERMKSKMTTKKKTTLALVVLALLGGGYYGKLWLEAANYGVAIKDLPKKRASWAKKIEEERF